MLSSGGVIVWIRLNVFVLCKFYFLLSSLHRHTSAANIFNGDVLAIIGFWIEKMYSLKFKLSITYNIRKVHFMVTICSYLTVKLHRTRIVISRCPGCYEVTGSYLTTEKIKIIQ